MTLEELAVWAQEKGISKSAFICAGAKYDLATNRIQLLDAQYVRNAIHEVCTMCGCSQALARQYLNQSNWNLLLAATAYKRDHGQTETTKAAETQT